MQILSQDSIGTHLTLSIDTTNSVDDLFTFIRERLTSFEEKYSRFISGNWLDDLNKNREGELDKDGKYMLSYTLDVAKKTDGYFDPTVGKRLTELGYGRKMIDDRGQMTGQKQGDYRDIKLVGNIVSLYGDIEIEFGGLGKGYLIDVIREMIEEYSREIGVDIIRYLIDFGGDLYGKGGWKVGLENPYALDEVIGTLVLDDIYLACSSGSKRKWGTHHHLIDPHTGESAREVLATFIEGLSGIATDAYATALSVMPFEKACKTLKSTPYLEGVILATDGRCYQSERSRSEIFVS